LQLRFLAKQPKAEASLSAIAAELAVGPSTAHHLVATLHGEGFLSQNPDNRWYRFGAEALWKSRHYWALSCGKRSGVGWRPPEVESSTA
jgi:DNA-binding IclR family transcriptional regulator